MRTYSIGEYFCGAGGMTLGALQSCSCNELSSIARVRPVWAVDSDLDACETYHRNIHEGEGTLARMKDDGRIPGVNAYQTSDTLVLNADVRQISPHMLNGIDGFLFGFPCNDFSSAGARRGLHGESGMLYHQGLKLISEHEPSFFVAENVSGLLFANNYEALSHIILGLKSAGTTGYDVIPHLYRFEEYGIPQTRHRIIIVGIRKDIAASLPRGFLPPAPTLVTISAGEALKNIPSDAPNHEPKKMSDTVARRLRLIGPGQNIWDVNNTLPKDLRLKDTDKTISSIYKVLDEHSPAYTVVGNGGGGTYMYHWEKRPTTDRERARLQTFPDGFAFEGSPGSVRRQIGMAFPPLGAKIIIRALIKTLHGIPYESVEANLTREIEPASIIRKKAASKKEADARRRKREEADRVATGSSGMGSKGELDEAA